MKDRNSLLISALAVAITVGNLAIPAAMPRAELAHAQLATQAATDHREQGIASACGRALTDLPTD
ncbi:hypothetical protein [uncultured Roseovarius sp.]|uniref:hypothetical protein n=1 Tax=Roseovarius sp. TaxID=1486281 RepID=UPI0025FE9D00|nr:hypothetical protein [uncultured Roseovarius sp.]